MSKIDVFISHSHKDKKVADAICHYFENEAIKCWIAPRDITPGANWAHSIASAIPKCKILLLIFSSHANMSDQVLREVELAVKNKLLIVPVKIEDIAPSGGMEYYLSTVHWIDAVSKKTEKYIKNLADTIKGFLENKSRRPDPDGYNFGTGKKKKTALFLLFASVFIIVLAVLGIVFKDIIFENDTENTNAASTTPPPTEESASPVITDAPTSSPTPSPTATIDPNISLDAIVAIPDDTLKYSIIKTLDETGKSVDGPITVRDMYNLTTLIIFPFKTSSDSYYSHREFYLPPEDMVYVETDNKIVSLEGLQYAKNLEFLVLSEQDIEDISPLSQLYGLEDVDLRYNKIKDISPLYSSTGLKNLTLKFNDIEDISGIGILINLKMLDLNYNTIGDFSPLSRLNKLAVLNLYYTNISDITPLESLKNLECLDISSNPVSNLSSLQQLENLRELYMSFTDVTKIYPLKFVESLEILNISYSEIQDMSVLLEMKSLKSLYTRKSTLSDYQDIINELRGKGCTIIGEYD